MRKILPAASLALSLALSLGCSKTLSRLMGQQQAKAEFRQYGPMEFHAARCDHGLKNIPYAATEPYSQELTLDVYWNNHSGLAPIIVNIHGGGWMIGDKEALNSVFRSRYLAARGYVVVNVNYRLMPHAPIQTQVEDVMGAVIWAKENAARFGADPGRVGVMGGSAGGHLAALVAWASDDPFFQPTGHAASSFDSDVKAAVLFYGVYDLEETISRGNEDLKPWATAYFLKTADPEKQNLILSHVSPKKHLDGNLPPTLFICGTRDEFDLYNQAAAFAERLRELGVPSGLYSVPEAKHAFDNRYGEAAVQAAMEAAAAWFDKHLK